MLVCPILHPTFSNFSQTLLNWNAEAGIFPENWVNYIAAVALVSNVCRWSTSMLLNMSYKQYFVFHKQGFNLSAPFQRWVILEKKIYIFLAATKQLYKWYFPSVRPSVRLSVCPSVCPSVCLSVTPFWLCSHHRIIMNFSGVITNDQSKVRAKGQGQRSKVKVTEVTTQLNRFRTVTPV